MDELVAAFVNLANAFDPYDFADAYGSVEEAHEITRGLLSSDEGMRALARWLNDVAENI